MERVQYDDRENLKEFLQEAELQQYYELFRDILKVTKLSQLKFVAIEDLAQIGLSKPEQRRYKKLYARYFPNTYLSKIKRLLTPHKKNDWELPSHSPITMEIQQFGESNVNIPTKHIISIDDITINKELGMGQFGVVQQGTWTTGNQRLQVAIKCLGNERLTSSSADFLKEAALMHTIEHPNIVRLYGVVLHLDSLMLVTELAPLRSLLECLQEVSLRPNFPVPNLCDFAEQICDGMTYLENNRLIHRDLAARNILVFSKDRVKISDFGLSRALGVGKDYYQTNYNVNLKLPVAWCAPECILYLRFTSSSDVWAYAVCLWEMFSYGFQPWVAFSGQQILEAIDCPNFQRLERPECCPEAYYTTMLECWSHHPNDRPTFKDLGPRLQNIRPEQMQATANFIKPPDGRRNYLEYKANQIITVLGKEEMTNSTMWYGVLPGGACGLFDPKQTKPYIKPKSVSMAGSISPHPTRNSSRSIRSSILRSDVKRHTYTGKRTIERSMISSPQGDVKHTGHVGLDGAYFGDISFLDPPGCPPRQIVTPYKPLEDSEQVPLINPNSPSHLSSASGNMPYPLLSSHPEAKQDCDEVDLPYEEKETKNPKKSCLKSVSERTTSKSIFNKVKSATLGKSHGTDESAAPKTEEVHEYQEISDMDTENIASNNTRLELLVSSENSPVRAYGDFGQSLLEEMESMFRSLDGNRRGEIILSAKYFDIDNVRSHTLSKTDKKKNFYTGTMKPMSAHDEKTLETAVALANEITTRSMNDLDGDKLPSSPSERSKFHFKFPLVSHHDNTPSEPDNEAASKQERRNFSDEANSVPDIQTTITKESRMAYTSLIEEPTPSSYLIMTHIATDPAVISNKLGTIPKTSRPKDRRSPHSTGHLRQYSASEMDKITTYADDPQNELPLPPRATKPKLVDKPRHFRKYPLKLPENKIQVNRSNIYQNTVSRPVTVERHDDSRISTIMLDRAEAKPDKNPFKNCTEELEPDVAAAEQYFEELSLAKDYVSVEDLLEFADQKPCGRDRGVESDEVRIMRKVLKEQANPEECLEALELCEWNVHYAIKLMRVKMFAGKHVDLKHCSSELKKANGDIARASSMLNSLE